MSPLTPPPGAILAQSNLSIATNVLHPATEASAMLSESLQRQARHIAYEFMRIKEGQLGSDSEDIGLGAVVLASQKIDEYFVRSLFDGSEVSALEREATLAEETLRELRTLQGVDHFFTVPMQQWFHGLAYLGVDYEYFSSRLFGELQKYRKNRDAAEARFLRPFHDYRNELLGVVGQVRGGSSFTFFSVDDRVKRDLLAKLQRREWNDMSGFYDLVGLRIIVGLQREVPAAVALVEGALRVHEAEAILSPDPHHFFRVDHIEIRNNDRGYRASHLNIRRLSSEDRRGHPTAEIQIMSRGIHHWGEIQRLLIYKEDRIPPEARAVINDYCRAAADFIVACEEGSPPDDLPEIDILCLEQIPDEALRSDVLDRLCDIEMLMNTYRSSFSE